MSDEQYQDIWLKGRLVQRGVRECQERYEIIRAFCEQYRRPFTVLDIGANSGYFSIRLTEDFPECTAVAVEQRKDRLLPTLQRNNNPRVLMLHRGLSVHDLNRLADVEHFDVTLALSVIHHIKGDYDDKLQAMRRLGDHLILELPTEDAACNPHYVQQAYIPRDSQTIGYGRSHLAGEGRPILLLSQPKSTLASAYIVTEGMKEKTNTLDMQIESTFDHKTVQFRNKPEQRRWHRGINLWTFLRMNGVWPSRSHIAGVVSGAWDGTQHGDIKPWNVILQGDRAVMIDANDPNTKTKPDDKGVSALMETIARA